jgi:hypothetical protein
MESKRCDRLRDVGPSARAGIDVDPGSGSPDAAAGYRCCGPLLSVLVGLIIADSLLLLVNALESIPRPSTRSKQCDFATADRRATPPLGHVVIRATWNPLICKRTA